ncbi:MAG TPA: PKD domain-containing protein [Chitinophagales bacterium]|nr:PKD domain-containing protein [Chitinophagales bacterium]
MHLKGISVFLKILIIGFIFLCSLQSAGQNCRAKFGFTVLNNLTVAFRDSSLGTPLRYFWDFDDGTSDSVRNPIHTYQQPGEYLVKLKVSAANGTCVDSASRRVRLNVVYPGDANSDGIVNNKDVLYVGLAYGAIGPVRYDTATTGFVNSVPWVQQTGVANFHGGFNLQHADCDGNGIINRFDINIIDKNYGLSSNKGGDSGCIDVNDIPLYFEVIDSIQVGTAVAVEIKLGDLHIPAQNVYGIAFTVNYSQELIQPGTVELDYSNSLLGTPADIVYLNKDSNETGKLETAVSRIDHNNITIAGKIGTLNFVMEENLAQKTFITDILSLSFSNITLIRNDETVLPVCAAQDSAVVFEKLETSASGNVPGERQVTIYPNPVNDFLCMVLPEGNTYQIMITNQLGMKVSNQTAGAGKHLFDVSHLARGIYFLHIRNDETVQTFKIDISR